MPWAIRKLPAIFHCLCLIFIERKAKTYCYLLDLLPIDLHVSRIMASKQNKRDAYQLEIKDGQLIVYACGRWTIRNIEKLDAELQADLAELGYGGIAENKDSFGGVVFDFHNLERIDTAGAFVLTRAIGCHDGICRMWSIRGGNKGHMSLISVAAEAQAGLKPSPPPAWYEPLTRLGQGVIRAMSEVYDTVAFFGHFIVILFKLMLRPSKIRWKSVVALIESVGLDALPIVVMLSFFIGAVIAFMGADLLASFGAKVFVVDLVGVSVLREFAVIITAILMAGRSNSAFTAQIGSMKMRQEIDAMEVIGLEVGETLIAPRAIACVVSAPILTFFAMISGLLGGMLVIWSQGITPILFTERLSEVVATKHFWVGMVKAPFFAIVIAVIGCRQGLAVKGSVESLGRRTTASVVQAIFTIIALDAVFAMMFLKLGV